MIMIRQSERDGQWYFLHTINNDPLLIPTILFSEGTNHKQAQAVLLELHSRGLCGSVTLDHVKEKMELVKNC